MTELRNRRRILYTWLLLSLITISGVGITAALIPSEVWSDDSKSFMAQLPQATVERTDFAVAVVSSGEFDSAENTLIECLIERVGERSAGGQRISTSGYSVIIDIAPEGKIVKKDEVICRIDGSDYEEMIYQKRIENDQARAQLKRAELDLESARIELTEYVDGTLKQQYQQYESRIALAEATVRRQKERVDWADQMVPLGYLTKGRYDQERQLLMRDELELERAQAAFDNFQHYTEPKQIRTFENRIAQRESNVAYLKSRLDRKEERLDTYEEQLGFCTIRAPHDGYLIYAEDEDDPVIDVGTEVRERMDLFILPNLEKMLVEVQLNETVVKRVKPGMEAIVRPVTFPGMTVNGVVKKVEPLPHQSRRSWMKQDVRQYLAVIEVESSSGLMPKMQAEVEIITREQPDALVIPREALTVEDGHEICYVVADRGLERREVQTRRGSVDELEVIDGLAEGEQVILNPTELDSFKDFVIQPSPKIASHEGLNKNVNQSSTSRAAILH